ncbi:MAG TPA: hypothetical protein VGB96_14105, partial [Archangium sp.]
RASGEEGKEPDKGLPGWFLTEEPRRRPRHRGDGRRRLSLVSVVALVVFELFTVSRTDAPWREAVATLLAGAVVAPFAGEPLRDTWTFRLRL